MPRPALSRPARQRLPRSLVMMLVLLALAGACSRFRRGEELEQEPAVVVFVNQSLDQADVYAVASSSERVRIGTVLPGATAELRVPSQMTNAGEVTIVARLLASSRAPSTGPLQVSPGTRYQVTLPIDERTLTVLPAS